ncbi:MAG TPA: peptidoglycan bridge formation glycyltransferase FemA/FemB family protein [Candidatus Bathyarchaeia archaeon]|nr:peptidoglycan bridge formation glycyltransferase FemA/FemB family protein [Candidatus Bathyarchaeia archaeon]
MPDLRQSKEYARYMSLLGWQVEKAAKSNVFIRKIPFLPFSVIKIQRPTPPIPLAKIDQLAQKYRALAVYLEPNTTNQSSSLTESGYRLSKTPFLSTKTLRLDLNQSEEKILSQMKKETRYCLRKAEKSSLPIFEVTKFADLHQAWKKSVGWQRHLPSLNTLCALKKAFNSKAIFLTANFLAGTTILIGGKTAYYFYAFTSKKGRESLAQYLLIWQAIKLAKKRGCRAFDFEGIYDSRFPQKGWQGFSHFKKSFGGKEVKYPGCFVKYRLPF